MISATNLQRSFQKNGWMHVEFDQSKRLIESLAQLKNQFIHEVTESIGGSLGVSFKKYNPDKKTEIEVIKSVVRGLLRYHPDAKRLAARNATQYLALAPEIANFYVTLLYPIIHLPSDLSEEGGFHIDDAGYSGKLYTLWTPLNDCDEKPISVIPKSHSSFRHFINRIYYNHRFYHKNRRKVLLNNNVCPTPKLGQALTWTGKTFHMGNLNQSSQTTTAMVIRITEKPFMMEPTKLVRDCENFEPVSLPQNASVFAKEFYEFYCMLKSISDSTRSLNSLFIEMKKQSPLWSLSPENRTMTSFGLSLVAQRVGGAIGSIFDLAAAILAHDNMISFERTLIQLKSQPDELQSFIAEYTELYDTRQSNEIIERVCGIPRFSESKPLFQWS